MGYWGFGLLYQFCRDCGELEPVPAPIPLSAAEIAEREAQFKWWTCPDCGERLLDIGTFVSWHRILCRDLMNLRAHRRLVYG